MSLPLDFHPFAKIPTLQIAPFYLSFLFVRFVVLAHWPYSLVFPKSRKLVPIRFARPCAQVPEPGSFYDTSVVFCSTTAAG
jgi:hypothetical protein